jgi:hypothetical protein
MLAQCPKLTTSCNDQIRRHGARQPNLWSAPSRHFHLSLTVLRDLNLRSIEQRRLCSKDDLDGNGRTQRAKAKHTNGDQDPNLAFHDEVCAVGEVHLDDADEDTAVSEE